MEDQKSESQENFETMLAQQEEKSEKLEPGQKVKGQIISVSGDDVFVDIGLKLDGIMDRKELLDETGNFFLKAGDTIEALVVNVSSQGARLSNSLNVGNIEALQEAMEAGIPVNGKVLNTCKGGFQVSIAGKRAFCPGSQMEFSSSGNNEDFIGKEMEFLITRIENNGRNIVVSRRALIDRQRKQNLETFLNTVKPEDIVTGVVTRLAPFGAFIELAPAIEGMVHLSELSWGHVEKPEDAVNVGDKVEVKILDLSQDDKGRQRISLSMRQAAEDPWLTAERNFKPGEIMEGTVRRLAPFGAFVEIGPGIEGLAHISELSWEKRIHKPDEVLKPGEKVSVKIKEIDPEKKRISLSVRDAAGDPWLDVSEKFAQGSVINGVIESKSPYGIFITLAPGITGLLPLSTLKNSPNEAEINKLAPGESLQVKVQKLDTVARRISLMPIEKGAEKPVEDTNWREHAKISSEGPALGSLGQLLQDALKKKKQG